MVRCLNTSWRLSLHVNIFSIINVNVIGKYLKGSGFEETILQAKLCILGHIKGVMNGKLYNRCWLINKTFAEALEQIFARVNVSICEILQ